MQRVPMAAKGRRSKEKDLRQHERREWFDFSTTPPRRETMPEPTPDLDSLEEQRGLEVESEFDAEDYAYIRRANAEHLRYASPDFNTGYGHDSRRTLPRDFVASSNYEKNLRERNHTGQGPKNFKRTDEKIREDICEILARHRGIDARDIDVEVKSGHVTLTGSVPERKMRYYAEDVADQSFGVVEITNNIKVHKTSEAEARYGKDH